MSAPEPSKATLANGLRVVLAPDHRVRRVAVAVHYGVGFRSEAAGSDGFAHLFEHLMFRGSESLPDGGFHDHIRRFGGEANGTTHQDYTDYYQIVPGEALELALFSEADRMRAPRFTPEDVADQLEGVEAEIRSVLVDRPYGGFPWPLLARVRYRSFENAHDGYGNLDVLRRVTPDDCAAFFDAQYAPGNAVLTVAGAFDADDTRALIERHFGDIPARPVPPPPLLAEPEPTSDRWETYAEPGVSLTAVAIAYRMPDPSEDLARYLAYLVQARLLSRQPLLHGSPLAIGCGCGFFGPLDARDPDTLVVTALVPPAVEPRQFLAAVDGWWAQFADPKEVGEAAADTVRVLVSEHRRDHADLQQRARALGRLEVLFGRAELLDELPERLLALGLDEVTAAAESLGSASKAVLVIEPGDTRTRPEPPGEVPRVEDPVAPRSAEDLASSTEGPRPVPAVRAARSPLLPSWSDTELGEGLRVVGVCYDGSPVVEFRLRAPLGVPAWLGAGTAELLVRMLRERTRAQLAADAFGGGLELTTDGQWLDISGYAPPSHVDDWLDVLAAVLAAGDLGPVPGGRRAAPPDPVRWSDDALRQRWLRGSAGDRTPGHDGDGQAADLEVPGPCGASFVAVGDIDPASVADRLGAAASSWIEAGSRRPALGVDPSDRSVVRVGWPGEDVHVTLCGQEPPRGADEPARYLATAIFGAYFRSRLIQRTTYREVEGYVAISGRDVVVDRPRAFVRASAPRALVTDLLDDVRAEFEAMTTRPPTAAEVEETSEYCASQLLGIFDSPRSFADGLRQALGNGLGPEWLVRAWSALRAVPAAEVAQAGAALFGMGPRVAVLLGDIDEDAESALASVVRPGSEAPPAPSDLP